jgi:hypothetical protein
LILHLKRFVFEMGEMSVVKKSKPVAYGTELVIPPGEVISHRLALLDHAHLSHLKHKSLQMQDQNPRESLHRHLLGRVLTTPGMKNSVTLEPYQPLQLDIQSSDILSITDALRHLSQPEIVPGVWSASRKANVRESLHRHLLGRVHVGLSRRAPHSWHNLRLAQVSEREMGEMSVVKKSKPVAYGTELVIPPGEVIINDPVSHTEHTEMATTRALSSPPKRRYLTGAPRRPGEMISVCSVCEHLSWTTWRSGQVPSFRR